MQIWDDTAGESTRLEERSGVCRERLVCEHQLATIGEGKKER